MTVPIGVLTNEAIRFIPRLPLLKQKAINSFKMGFFNKIALLFKSHTFQLPANYYLIIEDESQPSIAVSMNYLTSGVCVLYVAGSLAKELEVCGQKAAVDFGLSSLSKIFGNNIKNNYIKGVCTSWALDKYSLGAYSAAIPGLFNMRHDLSLPIDNRIFFAGEAYHKKWMTHLAGAYLSGIENADLAIRTFEKG